MGGRGASSSRVSFPRMPFGVRMGYGTKEEKRQAREITKKFISGARAGDVYSTGGGIGSGGSEFRVVEHRRSPNGLGIQGGHGTVNLNSANVRKYIANGAKLVSRSRKRR